MLSFITKFEVHLPKLVSLSTQIPREKLNKVPVFSPITPKMKRISQIDGMPFENLLDDNSLDMLDYEEANLQTERKECKKTRIKINRLRLHYYFTEANGIAEFMKNTEIEIRLTDGPDWHKCLAAGKTHPFRWMNPEKDSEVQMEEKVVYLFSK